MGLDRLPDARDAGFVLIVEGATDYAACLLGGIPVLAVPGANTWKKDYAAYISDIPRIIVWDENDSGGSALIKTVGQSRSDLLVVNAPPEAKDPCALRRLDPDGFPQRMSALFEEAKPPELGEAFAGKGESPTAAEAAVTPSVLFTLIVNPSSEMPVTVKVPLFPASAKF